MFRGFASFLRRLVFGSCYCDECGHRMTSYRCDHCVQWWERAFVSVDAAAAPGWDTQFSRAQAESTAIMAMADEFAEALMWVHFAHETLPPIRDDWSTQCVWCAREMRELCSDYFTHHPQCETIATCERHRAGLLALNADIRSGTWRERFS